MTTQDFKTSTIPSASFGQVKNSIRVVADRVEAIDQKVEAIDYGLRYVPARVGEIETGLHASSKNMEEIKWRNDVHSAKIKSMQQEMEEMRLQNEALRHQMQEFRNIPVYQESPRGDHYPGSPRRDVRDGYQHDRSPRGDYYQGRDAGGQVQAQPKRDEIFDPKESAVRYQNNESFRPARYHGPNQKLVGDYKTSYKSHFVEPKTLMQNTGNKQTQYYDDFVLRHEMKRQQQEREMMDNLPPTPLDYTKKKPLTYLNPHETEAKSPPENDITWETRIYTEKAPPLDRYFGEGLRNEPQAARGRDISPTRLKDGHHPTTYDTSYQPPRRDFSPAPSTVLTEDLPLDEKAKLKPTTYVNHYHFSKNPRNCGGYVFLRFSDSDFMEVCVAVTRLKGMLMSHNGKVVGIARKNDIRILKNNGTAWDTSKYKSHRDPGFQTRREEPVTDTNKAMLVFWFASYEDALNLMNASHGNPFFQRDFPRPDGYQAFYVPLREPDIDAGFPTFLLTEYPNPSKDPVVTKIEADSRQIIEKELPGECQPYLVSTEGGIRILRGDWMSPKSRVLVSRFPTSSKVLDLYKKDAFVQNKQSLTHYLGNETTVLFTLTELYCSDPYGQ